MSEEKDPIDSLKETGEASKKKKYLTIPSVKVYNAILDAMKTDPQMEEILENYFTGDEETKARNAATLDIIDGIDERIAIEKNPARKKVLEGYRAGLEKELKGKKKICMKVVLKYLLATNQNESIQELADLVNA